MVDAVAGLKFVLATDLHLVSPGERLWGLDPLERFDAFLADVEAFHADADFCVITGDLAERGDVNAYEALKQRLSHFPLKTFLLLGNHDDRANFLSVFGNPDENGYVQSVIHHGGMRFLFLDTLHGPETSAGLYDEKRQEWLRAQLAQDPDTPGFVFMHHPPFDIRHSLMDLIKLRDAEDFAAILKGANVRHLFFGHAHRPISGQWRGIPYCALPSLNHQLPLVGGSVSTVYSDEPPMYATVIVEPEQTIIHLDAFLHRKPAAMAKDAERGNWY